MNILIIYAHHEPSSFTAAMKNSAISLLTRQGHNVVELDRKGKIVWEYKDDYEQSRARRR